MQDYIEVEFRSGRLGYYLNPANLPVNPEDLVIVEVERGEDIAQIVHLSVPSDELEEQVPKTKVTGIKRIATEEDLEKLNNIGFEEDKAAKTFLDILERYSFEMKLIETIYQFDGNKLTFFFTAEGRIDFRQFVRELALVFKTRIELHQTTGRDEAKRLGGFGMCGLQYCCGSFLKRFNQVTIKMAKDQNLAGNLSKISGPCGRLLCCLNFEEDFYVEEARDFPLPGTIIKMDNQKLVVLRNDLLNKKVILSGENQEILEIDLDKFSEQDVISKPDTDPCSPIS
ncbi:MAG TPA: regulatory iron-sulfur-containing complex subunit RicT [Candidatus Cloacimonadota bacterium]|nr:regulatory iron-sulfur-containing complex subunit RicT [Candidatus Cloacimonadota bacterium]HPS38336.1 regulatory iron-sulfur-containing complex subunit RicT [Candidatus Cloacimonadota bacterium]